MKLAPYFLPTEGGDSVFNIEAVKIKFGFGALRVVGAEARAFGMKRVAIYTDKNVAKLEPVSIAANAIKQAGLDSDPSVFDLLIDKLEISRLLKEAPPFHQGQAKCQAYDRDAEAYQGGKQWS